MPNYQFVLRNPTSRLPNPSRLDDVEWSLTDKFFSAENDEKALEQVQEFLKEGGVNVYTVGGTIRIGREPVTLYRVIPLR